MQCVKIQKEKKKKHISTIVFIKLKVLYLSLKYFSVLLNFDLWK